MMPAGALLASDLDFRLTIILCIWHTDFFRRKMHPSSWPKNFGDILKKDDFLADSVWNSFCFVGISFYVVLE